MDILKMDKETTQLLLSIIVGISGWMYAIGRRSITDKVIKEISELFVKRELYDVELKGIHAAINSLKSEQKTNHADMVHRLDKIVEQINNKIEKLQE